MHCIGVTLLLQMCLRVGRTDVLCKNGWNDWDAV